MASTELKPAGLYIVEEVEIYREMYKSIFPRESPVKLLGVSNNQNLPAIWGTVSELAPDVLLIGAKQLNNVIVAELQKLREDFPGIGLVLLLTLYDAANMHLLKGLVARGKAGMAIFLRQSLEQVDELCGIITSVNEGHVILDPALTSLLFADKQGHPLLKEFTPRELELLNLLSRGYTNSAIAEALFIDIRTVQRHINNMYSKIKANNEFNNRHLRVSAARLYLETSGELLTAADSKVKTGALAQSE